MVYVQRMQIASSMTVNHVIGIANILVEPNLNLNVKTFGVIYLTDLIWDGDGIGIHVGLKIQCRED